jgi:PAS domain-containing protein
VRKDGTIRWLEIMTSRIDYQGQPAIQAACIDVTERHRALEALHRSEARNEAFLNANPDLMFRLTGAGCFSTANRQGRRRLGFARAVRGQAPGRRLSPPRRGP